MAEEKAVLDVKQENTEGIQKPYKSGFRMVKSKPIQIPTVCHFFGALLNWLIHFSKIWQIPISKIWIIYPAVVA